MMPKSCSQCRLRKIKCDRKFPQCTACQKSRRGLECNFEAGHVVPQPRPKSLPKGEACAPCRRKKKKCTAERPSCKLCKSTGTEKDCVYEPTWRVLSATDIESISRRNSTTPVSCSEDGDSSQTDEYDYLPWTGDCPKDVGYQSHSAERQIMDALLRQDYCQIVPYEPPCGDICIEVLKQDGQQLNPGFTHGNNSQPPGTTYSSLAEWNG